MDFDINKMIATLGYIDGSVEILKIEKTVNAETFYSLNLELRVQQRENILSLSIISNP